MALAALCPEKTRLEFAEQRAAGHIADYDVAVQLRIPEQHIYSLFEPSYLGIVQDMIGKEGPRIVKMASD